MSSKEMKFMDAGKAPESVATLDKPNKYYPKFTIDLDQFPDLEAEVDESVELKLKGRVCGITHNEWSHTMEVEVQAIAIPSHTSDDIGPRNKADEEFGKMRSKISRGY